MMPIPSSYCASLPVVRFTAATAGTYSYSGSIIEENDSSHSISWWLVKKTSGGTYTTLASGTGLTGTAPLSGSQSLAVGDSLDIIVDADSNWRPWARVIWTISGP
jgi:hypothetical protein